MISILFKSLKNCLKVIIPDFQSIQFNDKKTNYSLDNFHYFLFIKKPILNKSFFTHSVGGIIRLLFLLNVNLIQTILNHLLIMKVI